MGITTGTAESARMGSTSAAKSTRIAATGLGARAASASAARMGKRKPS